MLTVEEAIDQLKAGAKFSLPKFQRFRNHVGVVTAALEQDVGYYEGLPPVMRDYKPLALMVLAKNGRLLKHCSRTLQADKEVVLTAYKNAPISLMYADFDLRIQCKGKDPFLVLEEPNVERAKILYDNGTDLDDDYFHQFLENVEFAKHVACKNYKDIKRLPKSMQDEFDVAKAAIQSTYQTVLSLFSERLRNSYELVKLAVEKNSENFKYASDELKSNAEIAYDAISQDSDIFGFISDKLKDNPKFMLRAVELNPDNLFFGSKYIKDNEVIALAAIKKKPSTMMYLSKRLLNICQMNEDPEKALQFFVDLKYKGLPESQEDF